MESNEDSDAVRKKKIIKMQIANIMGNDTAEEREIKAVNDV
jgi:hypothetical protein